MLTAAVAGVDAGGGEREGRAGKGREEIMIFRGHVANFAHR
jgi:hypothetical protein